MPTLCFPVTLLNLGIEEGGGKSWSKFPMNATDGERAIVLKITNKQKQKYFVLRKRPRERHLAVQFVEAGRSVL